MTYLEEQEFVKEFKQDLIEKLNYYHDCTVYASELGYYLFQSESVDGSVLYCTYQTKEFIKKHFDLFGWLVEYLKDNFDMTLNPFTTPEKAHVYLCLQIADNIIRRLPYIQKKYDDEIILNKKTIKILTKEINALELEYEDLLY